MKDQKQSASKGQGKTKETKGNSSTNNRGGGQGGSKDKEHMSEIGKKGGENSHNGNQER